MAYPAVTVLGGQPSRQRILYIISVAHDAGLPARAAIPRAGPADGKTTCEARRARNRLANRVVHRMWRDEHTATTVRVSGLTRERLTPPAPPE